MDMLALALTYACHHRRAQFNGQDGNLHVDMPADSTTETLLAPKKSQRSTLSKVSSALHVMPAQEKDGCCCQMVLELLRCDDKAAIDIATHVQVCSFLRRHVF